MSDGADGDDYCLLLHALLACDFLKVLDYHQRCLKSMTFYTMLLKWCIFMTQNATSIAFISVSLCACLSSAQG